MLQLSSSRYCSHAHYGITGIDGIPYILFCSYSVYHSQSRFNNDLATLQLLVWSLCEQTVLTLPQDNTAEKIEFSSFYVRLLGYVTA